MTQAAVRIVVSGAGGRMGSRIINLALAQPERFKLFAATERADSPLIGEDAGVVAGAKPAGVKIAAEFHAAADVLLDFSSPAGVRAMLQHCVRGKMAMLIGATGLTPDDQLSIDAASRSIAVLQTGNTSLGVHVLLQIVAEAARRLGPNYDVEIVEKHHNLKKDAPSGTALSLAEAIGRAIPACRENPEAALVHGRHGPDTLRRPGTIGMHALRMGDVVGEHTVYFAAPGERMELTHVATTRDTFARGALRAAEFLAGKKPGRYSMAHVLEI